MTVSAAPVLSDGLVDDDDLDDALLSGVLEGMATSAAPPSDTTSAGVPSEGHRGDHACIHPGSIALGEDRGEAREGRKGAGRFVPPLGGSDEGDDDVDLESDAFAKELAAGMEELMRDLAAAESSSVGAHSNRSTTPFTATASSSSSKTTGGGDKTRSGGLSDQEQQDELIAAFQAFMGQVSQTEERDSVDETREGKGNGHPTHEPVPKTASNGSSSETRTSATAGGGNSSFQDRIRMTMDKLKDSSDQAGAAQGDLEGGADMDTLMAEMMQQMDALADSNELDSVLEGMMQSLLSKDILQEPLTELATKYPAYLEAHRDTLPAEQLDKYTQQHALIQRILDLYKAGQEEAEGKQIVSLMTQIQELGQPPPELLKELSPDLEMDMKTGLPAFPSASGAGGAPGECTIM